MSIHLLSYFLSSKTLVSRFTGSSEPYLHAHAVSTDISCAGVYGKQIHLYYKQPKKGTIGYWDIDDKYDNKDTGSHLTGVNSTRPLVIMSEI